MAEKKLYMVFRKNGGLLSRKLENQEDAKRKASNLGGSYAPVSFGKKVTPKESLRNEIHKFLRSKKVKFSCYKGRFHEAMLPRTEALEPYVAAKKRHGKIDTDTTSKLEPSSHVTVTWSSSNRTDERWSVEAVDVESGELDGVATIMGPQVYYSGFRELLELLRKAV